MSSNFSLIIHVENWEAINPPDMMIKTDLLNKENLLWIILWKRSRFVNRKKFELPETWEDFEETRGSDDSPSHFNSSFFRVLSSTKNMHLCMTVLQRWFDFQHTDIHGIILDSYYDFIPDVILENHVRVVDPEILSCDEELGNLMWQRK